MDWTEFKGSVKNSSLPFYLSDTEDHTENVYCQNIHPTLIAHLSSKEFFFHRQPSGDLSTEESPGAGFEYGIDGMIPKGSSSKRYLQSYLTKLIQDLLTNPSKTIPLRSQRIRCSSLERVSLDELKMFYRYQHCTKVVKKMCDTNLWLLIHELSGIFRQKDPSKQPLLLDLGRLMLHFIFCSINQLRFEQCRSILEKLEKLENCFYEGSSIKVSAPKSVGMSPMQGSPHGNKQVSLINLPKTPQSYSPNPMTPISGRPPTHPSLSHLAPRLNHSNSILSATPKVRPNISLAMQQAAAESNIKQHANRKILLLIGKVKYTIAQMGHFLHYDHQSNRVMELITKKNRDRGDEKSNNSSTSIPNISSMYTPNNKESSKKVFTFTAAYDSSTVNSPIQLQKMDKPDEKGLLYENVTSSASLKHYFYNTQNFLDDFDEKQVTRRQELLTKYCKYKVQKWIDNRAREKLEQKYEDFKIVCKLCANKVQIDKMKEHSKLCRRNMELDKEIKDFDNKISDLVFKAFMGSKELHTKFAVDSKRYKKLKEEISKEVNAVGLLAPRKLSKGELSKKDQSASFLFRSGTVNSSTIAAAIEGFKTPKAGGAGDHAKPTSILPAPEKRKAFLFSGITMKQLQAEDTTTHNPLYNSFATDRHNSELSHKTRSPERETGSQDKSQKNESIASNELESPLRKKKHPILDMLSPQNHTRRYSADLDKEKAEPRQKKLSTFAKRDAVRGIDTNALHNMLLTLNNDKDQAQSPQKISAINETHSVGIRTPTSERSRSASLYSGSLTQLNGESQVGSIVEDGPPLITQTKSMTPFNFKAHINELKAEDGNLLDVPQKRDSFEEIAAGITRRKNKRHSANPDEKKQESIGTLPDSDEVSQKAAPPRFERSNLKKQTVIVQAGNPLLPSKVSTAVEKKADTKITEKMVKLRKEMNKKKVIIRLFEIIREKGKSMTNQPPYAKSLEMTQSDIIEEIASLKTKVDDKEILELTEQFLNLIEERVVKGKLLRDTKRELNKLDGIVEQEQTPKTNIDRRPSLMKGANFISPKSISFMQSLLKKSDSLGSTKSGKSDSRTSLTRDRKSSHSKIVQEQEVSEESSPLIIKASCKPKLKKRLSKFGRLELQDADSCEGSKNSLVTGDPGGGLIQNGPFCSEDKSDGLSQLSKPAANGHDSSIIESQESVTDSESEEDTSNNRSNSQGTSRSDLKKKTAHFRSSDKKNEVLDLIVQRHRSPDKKQTAVFGQKISIEKLGSSEAVSPQLPMRKKQTAYFGGAPSSIEEIVAREEEQLGLQKKKTGHFVNVASIEEMTPAFIKQSNKSSEDALQSRPSMKLGGFSGAIQEHSEYSNTDHDPSLSVMDNNKCSLIFHENFNNHQTSGNKGSDGNQARSIRKQTSSIDLEESQTQPLTIQTISMIGGSDKILCPTVLFQARSDPQNVLFEEKKIATPEQPNKPGDLFAAAQNFSLSKIEGDDQTGHNGSKNTFSKNTLGGTPRHRSKSAIDNGKTPTQNKTPQQNKDWENIERISSESERESDMSCSQTGSSQTGSKSSSHNSLTESSHSGHAFAEGFVNEKRKGNKKGKEKVESLLLLDTALEKGYHSDSYVNTTRVTESLEPLIGMKDFEPIKMISKGAYGRVWLVKRKATNDFYAMKVVNLTEKFMKNTKELENLRKENKVFGLAQEDFVVRALFTFTYETCICFVMEYMLGGDFGDILYNYSALEEDVARFYIAEIILAVEYLHSLEIIHRDLKPDNILLDKKGHAKLTDFGLSETGLSKKIKAGSTNQNQEKLHAAISRLCAPVTGLSNHINLKFKGKVMEKIHKDSGDVEDEHKEQESKNSLPSPREREDAQAKKRNSKRHHRLIGTPDYMAPEIILGGSVMSYSLDWWSLGCILFEFLVGIPPFNDETQELVFDNIVNLRIPWSQITIGYGEDCVSPEAADLIQKLLTLDHTKRLGTNGVDEIKNHKFFEGIDWKNLRQQQPPIIPEHKSDGDTTNFVRLAGQMNEKENEDFFSFIPNKNAVPNLAAVKQYLESASESFNMFNIKALDSDNLKLAEEAMKQREEEMKRFRKHSTDDVVRKNKYYDDVFDAPE